MRRVRPAGSPASQQASPGRVVAIIPTWRKPEDVLQAVRSLRNGTIRPARTVILDNGSGTATLDALRRGTAGLEDVELVALGSNLGFAAAVNRGVERALADGARHILLMNDDAILEPECLEHLLRALDACPEAGMAAPRILYHGDRTRVWQGEGRYSRWRTGVVSREKNRLVKECAGERRPATFATGCVLLIAGAVFDAVGLFDEDLYFYEEDVEFERRAQAAGHGIVYEPAAIASHKIEDIARGRTTPFVLYHLARSRLLRLRRGGGLELPWGLALHFLAYTPFRLLQVWRGRGGLAAALAWLRGTRDGLTHRRSHA